MTSVQPLKSAIKSTFRSFGYDLIPFPLNEWFERRLTLGRHLMQIFAHCKVNCVLDVGAHYGEYAAFLREVGYTGKLVSFEPVARNFEQLRARAAQDPQWEIHNMALGQSDTTMEITVCHDTELSSFLTPNDYCASHMGTTDLVAGTEQVQVRTLDTMFEECVAGIADPRVFLKLDTQGYDLMVLGGAGRHLARVHGLQSEVSLKPIYNGMPSYLEALPAFKELGFEATGMFPVNRDCQLLLIEVDCVMVRTAQHARAEHHRDC